MKHGKDRVAAAAAFLILALASLPADAAIGPPPFLADLANLRIWVLVVVVFFVFVAILACGASVLGKRYGEAFVYFIGIVVGGSIIATATGLTTGIAGGVGGGGLPI